MIQFREIKDKKNYNPYFRDFEIVENGAVVAKGALHLSYNEICMQLNCLWDGEGGVYDFLFRGLLNVVRDIPNMVCFLESELFNESGASIEYFSQFGFMDYRVATKDICFTSKCKK
ncbi:MAG: hypothetical protein FWE13_04990 [Firmicutes bacterium]|nr:hypothetical protein [Bacillota bacterium]